MCGLELRQQFPGGRDRKCAGGIPAYIAMDTAGPPAFHIATTASAARVRKAGTSGCRAMSNFMSGAFSPDKISEKSRNNP